MTESCNRRLRKLLGERKAVLLPGAANALTARVIEDIGFKAIYVTGAGVTNTSLGVPDIGLITLTELASHVSAMRDAVALPLIVDADTGFGNAINVGRTIQVLERSGANAIQLEDQEFPKRCGHFSGKSVIPRAEMVQKIRAAVDARIDPDLVIVARTDAIAVNGFEDAMERAAAYIEAGADMTFVEAPRTKEQIAEIPKRLSCAAIHQHRRRRLDADDRRSMSWRPWGLPWCSTPTRRCRPRSPECRRFSATFRRTARLTAFPNTSPASRSGSG